MEDKAVEKETEHQVALKRLAEFLPSALWEKTKATAFETASKVVSFSARCVEYTKEKCAAFFDRLRGFCERLLAGLYETGRHEVVLSSPDKVDQKYASERNRVVRFLAAQKSRAMEGLTDRILDPKGKRSRAEREHAARTLAAILGRRIHRDELEHARSWMRRIARRNYDSR